MQLVLYDLRKNQKKMTQEQMANYLGITPKTYRSKELGNTEFTLDETFEIAKLFNKKVDDIFLPRKYHTGTKTMKGVKGGYQLWIRIHQLLNWLLTITLI